MSDSLDALVPLVLKAVSNFPRNIPEIQRHLGIPEGAVKTALKVLVKAGKVTKETLRKEHIFEGPAAYGHREQHHGPSIRDYIPARKGPARYYHVEKQ